MAKVKLQAYCLNDDTEEVHLMLYSKEFLNFIKTKASLSGWSGVS